MLVVVVVAPVLVDIAAAVAVVAVAAAVAAVFVAGPAYRKCGLINVDFKQFQLISLSAL